MSEWHLSFCIFFFFQAEDGIRDLVRSRGLGDVYKRQAFSKTGERLVGQVAKRQAVTNPDRTIQSIKREMLSLIHI